MAFPVKLIDSFAGQNWLITPAAPALPPAEILEQKWLLTLSGVGIVNLAGNDDDGWLNETLLLEPTVIDPMRYAIAHHSIPEPPGSEGDQYSLAFQVEQLAPFASVGAASSAGGSAGFAVETWRPNHWGSGIDAFTHQYLGTLFSGLAVDVGVLGGDAWLGRVGYDIALLGRIVFVAGQETLFQSNFDLTAVDQPPSPTQQVGSAAVQGPPRSVIVIDAPVPSPGRWVQISRPNNPEEIAALDCIPTQAPGPGVYMFSAEIFLSDASGIATVSFLTAGGEEEFLHVDFLPNHRVRVDDVGAEFGAFPRPGAFIVQVALNLGLSESTATIVLSGAASGAQQVKIQPALQHLAPQFGVVRIWQGLPNTGAFAATDIALTRSLD